VDESPFYENILRQLLYAFEIPALESFNTYENAMSALRVKPFEMLIIDWQLEGKDKLELIRTIREGHGVCDPNIPIILCTAHTRRSKIEYARDIGVTEILVKPLRPDQLMSKMIAGFFRNRSFVESSGYSGPCRRRQIQEYYGPERRGKAGFDQSQVDDVMEKERNK
jgi:DNA-binding response OmpR family regulator